MADFADSTATTLDVELLTPAAAGRLSPALPAGEQVLESNLYAVCELVAGRAARTSSARQYRAIYTRFCEVGHLGCRKPGGSDGSRSSSAWGRAHPMVV